MTEPKPDTPKAATVEIDYGDHDGRTVRLRLKDRIGRDIALAVLDPGDAALVALQIAEQARDAARCPVSGETPIYCERAG